MRASIGRTAANLAVVGAAVLGVAVLVLTTLAVLRLTRVAARHRRTSLQAVATLGVVWVLLVLGVRRPAHRIHERSRSGRPRGTRCAGRPPRSSDLRRRDRPRPLPRHASRPAADRLARQGRPPRVRRELREGRGPGTPRSRHGSIRLSTRGPRRLQAAGFSVPKRLPHLVDVRRSQLAGALHDAVGALGRQPTALRPARQNRPPHAQRRVQEGRVADRRRRAVEQPGPGRRGRRSTTTTSSTTGVTSGIAARGSRTPPCPTSTSSSALQRLELAKRDRRPVFAEVDLVSSHAPWTRIPRLIDWSDVGDGSVFGRIPVDQVTRTELFSDPDAGTCSVRPVDRVHAEQRLVSFVQHYGDDNLVLVVLGDHQPCDDRHRAEPDVTTCRSRSSPTIRRCWTGSPGGAGRTACGPARKRRSGR